MIKGNVLRYSYGGGQADAFAVWRGEIGGKPVGYALVVDGQWRFYGPDGHRVEGNRFGMVEDERLYESRSGLTGTGRVFVAAPFRWVPVHAIRVDVGTFDRVVPETGGLVVAYARDRADVIDAIDGHDFESVPALVCHEGEGPEFKMVARYYAPNLGRSIWQTLRPDAVWGIRVAPGKWLVRGFQYRFIYAPELEGALAFVLKWGYCDAAARRAAKALVRAIAEDWGHFAPKCFTGGGEEE